MNSQNGHERLVSLDLLRGLDIFLLTVICGFVGAVNRLAPLPRWFLDQFDHPAWVGFSFHDLIMPLFIFMSGAALPFALSRRLEPDGSAGWRYWRHVLSRVALLWFWGMVCQGCLTSFDLTKISFFNNTLQTIAVGYLITAAVTRIPSKAIRIAFPFALAALYTILLHTLGDLTPTGNFAVVYETRFLRLFFPADWWGVRQIAHLHYTWWTTVPMFGAMTLAGYHATIIVLSPRTGPQKVRLLAATGLGLLALGGALMTFDPCVKHIFTASFTSLATGCSFLFFAACYFVADVKKWRRGSSLILLYGRNSLAAYVMACCLSPTVWSLVRRFLCNGSAQGYQEGLARFLPEAWAGLVGQFGFALALTLALRRWSRVKRP